MSPRLILAHISEFMVTENEKTSQKFIYYSHDFMLNIMHKLMRHRPHKHAYGQL